MLSPTAGSLQLGLRDILHSVTPGRGAYLFLVNLRDLSKLDQDETSIAGACEGLRPLAGVLLRKLSDIPLPVLRSTVNVPYIPLAVFS